MVTSYDLFQPDANCRDTKAPGQAKGLSPDNIKLLSSRNTELNDVLTNGAKKYQFETARPVLAAAHDLERPFEGLQVTRGPIRGEGHDFVFIGRAEEAQVLGYGFIK